MKKHYNITVTGKVQGVFYRVSTQEKAEQIGLCGYVENKNDGSVYIEAEGSTDQLKELIEWCYKGPRNAKVDKVVFTEGELKGFENFEVSR